MLYITSHHFFLTSGRIQDFLCEVVFLVIKSIYSTKPLGKLDFVRSAGRYENGHVINSRVNELNYSSAYTTTTSMDKHRITFGDVTYQITTKLVSLPPTKEVNAFVCLSVC